MEILTKNGKTLSYEFKRNTKNTYRIRLKGDTVYVSAPKRASKKAIEDIISERFDFLYEKLLAARLNKTVHLGGIPFTLLCRVGKKSSVELTEGNLVVTAARDEKSSFERAIRAFYKKCVEAELIKLVYDAQYDFREIEFPKITVSYMTSRFGCYNRKTNVVKLSSLLAKYDPKYIKPVLYHELSHTLEFNHSAAFYAVLEGKLPGARALDREMKRHRYNDVM